MKSLIFCHIVAVVLVVDLSVALKKQGQAVYDSLPDNEKSPFLRYHIMRGYLQLKNSSADVPFIPDPFVDEHIMYHIGHIAVPPTFSRLLCMWVVESFGVPFNLTPQLACTEQVCNEHIKTNCVNIDDIGGNCCPF